MCESDYSVLLADERRNKECSFALAERSEL
ncbi:hypothetical protein ABIE27_003525 [Paenibacillus sp. 4624]